MVNKKKRYLLKKLKDFEFERVRERQTDSQRERQRDRQGHTERQEERDRALGYKYLEENCKKLSQIL